MAGQDPGNATGAAIKDMNVYLMIGLWNPNRSPITQTNRPPVRLRATGVVAYGNKYGNMSTLMVPFRITPSPARHRYQFVHH